MQKASTPSNPRYRALQNNPLKPIGTFLLAAFIAFFLVFSHRRPWTLIGQEHGLNPLDTPWSDIEPLETLSYSRCYDGLECARIKLPMDWNNTDSKDQFVAIALLKIPAKVPVTDPRYGGPVFINPGGPGGSGIGKILKDGEKMRKIVDHGSDPEDQSVSTNLDARYFDIVGFDPRGVNHSTPKLVCFPDQSAREAWMLQNSAEGIIGSSSVSFDQKWARWGSLAGSCMHRVAADNASSIAFFMNTTPVVADMLEILERHGEWRQKQAEAWIASPEGHSATANIPDPDPRSRKSIVERTKWKRGEDKMSYWGISYGSVIGATFAAMFPDRVSRFVLDGVEGAQEHYDGHWTSSIKLADEAVEQFFKLCFDAGRNNCPIYLDAGPEAMQSQFDSLLDRIKETPLAVPASSWRGPDVITYSNVKTVLKDALYSPIQDFPIVARLLADLNKGNGTAFADLKKGAIKLMPQPPLCRNEGPYAPACVPPNEWLDETEASIMCTDGESTENETKEAVKAYVMQTTEQSRYVGDIWAEYHLRCMGWSVRPKWRYSGPIQANTSYPLLIIANTLDPITPGQKYLHTPPISFANNRVMSFFSAYRLSQDYKGSVVLEQNCVGHGSLSAPSVCTANAVRRYFQNGNLPPPHSRCEVDQLPFHRGV